VDVARAGTIVCNSEEYSKGLKVNILSINFCIFLDFSRTVRNLDSIIVETIMVFDKLLNDMKHL
jgi:hypothetical protein